MHSFYSHIVAGSWSNACYSVKLVLLFFYLLVPLLLFCKVIMKCPIWLYVLFYFYFHLGPAVNDVCCNVLVGVQYFVLHLVHHMCTCLLGCLACFYYLDGQLYARNFLVLESQSTMYIM